MKYRNSPMKQHKSKENPKKIKMLLQAIHDDEVEKVERLIGSGVDLNCRDEAGNSPLHIAVHNDNFSMVKLLVEYVEDLDVLDKKGKTPLYYAEKNGFDEIVSVLE